MAITSCLPRGELGDEHFPLEPLCSCGRLVTPREAHRLTCDRSQQPYLDKESLRVAEDATALLACLRGGKPRDAGAWLSCLASLIAECRARLPDAVADAREQGFTWAEVASRLAGTAPTLRRRYGYYARWRAGQALGQAPLPGR